MELFKQVEYWHRTHINTNTYQDCIENVQISFQIFHHKQIPDIDIRTALPYIKSQVKYI